MCTQNQTKMKWLTQLQKFLNNLATYPKHHGKWTWQMSPTDSERSRCWQVWCPLGIGDRNLACWTSALTGIYWNKEHNMGKLKTVTAIFCETRDKNHPNTHNREHNMGKLKTMTAIFCETRDKNHPNTHNREHNMGKLKTVWLQFSVRLEIKIIQTHTTWGNWKLCDRNILWD